MTDTSSTTGARRVDLNAARKARAEQRGGAAGPVVELGDATFELPASLPVSAIVGFGRLRKGDTDGFEDVIVGLFGDRADEAMRLGLDLEDLGELMGAYGPGEDSASGT